MVPSEDLQLAFDETMSLVCTLYRDKAQTGHFSAKEASFSLQQVRSAERFPQKSLMAKASIDLARYCSVETVTEEVRQTLLHDGVPVGDIMLTISTRWLKNYSRPDTGQSIVHDSESDRSTDFGFGSESETTSGFYSTDADTDADTNSISGLTDRDLDTDEEIEAAEAAATETAEDDDDAKLFLRKAHKSMKKVRHHAPHHAAKKVHHRAHAALKKHVHHKRVVADDLDLDQPDMAEY